MAAGIFASADKSAQTAVGRDFEDEAVKGSRSGGCGFERGHGTAEGDVASASKAAWTSVGHVVAVRRGGEGERGPPPWTRLQDDPRASTNKSARTAAGDVATDEGRGGKVWQLALTRSREGRGDHRLCGQVRVECHEGCCLEAARVEGKREVAVTDETTGRPRGDISSVDEALRTTMWRTVTDEAMAKKERGPLLQTQLQDGRCGHHLCGKIRLEGCGG